MAALTLGGMPSSRNSAGPIPGKGDGWEPMTKGVTSKPGEAAVEVEADVDSPPGSGTVGHRIPGGDVIGTGGEAGHRNGHQGGGAHG